MIIKGFKFGMILQLAVGPMCLMVFNTSSEDGFHMSLPLVAAIALVDALYIALSCAGAAVVIGKEKIKWAVKLLGCLVLVLFGANIIINAFELSLLPDISLFNNISYKNIFIQGLLLTASNPLTIIFWSGVFSAQIAQNSMTKKQVFMFGLGCVLSTLVFLSAVAEFGSVMKNFLPDLAIKVLNIAVGAFIIFFGIRMLIKKQTADT